MLSLGEGEGREIEERGTVEHGSAFFFFALMFFLYFGFYWVLEKVFFLVLEFFFRL